MSKPVITDSLDFPEGSNIIRAFYGIGAAGLIASVVGYTFNEDQFFFSYLNSFTFFTGIGLSAILMIMLHHITRSSWGTVIRRISEAFSANMYIWAIFIIPIILGVHNLFHWSHVELLDPASAEYDKILAGKKAYLNVPFFIGRQILYFAIWGYLGFRLHKLSIKMDETGDWGITTLLRKISAPGILLFALSIAFAGFDWLMSLDPHWFSTMFGVYFFAMSFQAFWPIMILTVFFLQRNGILKNVIGKVHVYDMGAWFFAFTVFYAYIAFSQFLLIYYANLPEETLWFYDRMEGGYQYIMYGVLLFRFVLPFLVLLNRSAKYNRTVLTVVSIIVITVHFAELYWIIMPVLTHGHGLHFSWIDITSFIGLGGIFFGMFFQKFAKHKLIPVNDPKLEKSLSTHYHD